MVWLAEPRWYYPSSSIMSATPFQTEAWTEYGLGTLILFLRFFARLKAVGIKGWQGDDWFAVVVLIFWTVSQACTAGESMF